MCMKFYFYIKHSIILHFVLIFYSTTDETQLHVNCYDITSIIDIEKNHTETSMDMAIQWSTTAPRRFGIQGYTQVLNLYVRGEVGITCKDLHSIVFSPYIHIF